MKLGRYKNISCVIHFFNIVSSFMYCYILYDRTTNINFNDFVSQGYFFALGKQTATAALLHFRFEKTFTLRVIIWYKTDIIL